MKSIYILHQTVMHVASHCLGQSSREEKEVLSADVSQ